MPEPVNARDRVLIVGKTQSGKTTLARKLLAGFTGSRIVINDVKGQLDIGEAVREPEQLRDDVRVIRYVPLTLERRVFERFYQVVWHMAGPTVLLDDEAAVPTTGGYAPRYSDVYQQQGAQLQKGRIACSQRPVRIAVNLRSEAEHWFIFVPPPAFTDLRELAPEMQLDPGELQRLLRELQAAEGPHAFLWWHRASGDVTPCAPLDPGWAAVPIAA